MIRSDEVFFGGICQRQRGNDIMPTYGMGDAIHEMRIRAGCTQEELAYGICTPGTLSRIENGKEVASKQVFEALCQRLCGRCHMEMCIRDRSSLR